MGGGVGDGIDGGIGDWVDDARGVAGEPVTRLLPGRVGLFVRLQALPGGRPAVLDALHTYVDRLREEPGTEAFLVSVDPTDGDMVWLHEWFRDEQALEAHGRSGAFGQLMAAMTDRLAAPAGLLRVDPLRLHVSAELFASLLETS